MKESEQKNFLRLKRTGVSAKSLFRVDDDIASNLHQQCTKYMIKDCEIPDTTPVISKEEADVLMVPIRKVDANGVEYEEMIPCTKGEKITGRYGKTTI